LLPPGTWIEKRLSAPLATSPAVPASARPAAATIIIEKLMIAITHGVGPRSGWPPSRRRSGGDTNSQSNIRPHPAVAAGS
jgi:hypothetical protein